MIRHAKSLYTMVGRLSGAVDGLGEEEVFGRLERVRNITKYPYHLEILTDISYEEVTQIFLRVNGRGRALKTTDLALATLSSRWPGVLAKLENEAAHWKAHGYGHLDVTFLTRALTGGCAWTRPVSLVLRPTRYSQSTDTLLGQDLTAIRSPEPVKALLGNLGLLGRATITEQALVGRSVSSPYFLLSYLVARRRHAKD